MAGEWEKVLEGAVNMDVALKKCVICGNYTTGRLIWWLTPEDRKFLGYEGQTGAFVFILCRTHEQTEELVCQLEDVARRERRA